MNSLNAFFRLLAVIVGMGFSSGANARPLIITNATGGTIEVAVIFTSPNATAFSGVMTPGMQITADIEDSQVASGKTAFVYGYGLTAPVLDRVFDANQATTNWRAPRTICTLTFLPGSGSALEINQGFGTAKIQLYTAVLILCFGVGAFVGWHFMSPLET